MIESLVAKNLLLNRNCWNCRHCSALSDVEYFNRMTEERFLAIAGFPKDQVHDNAIMSGAIWECSGYIVPEKNTCEYWEEDY